ncbi:FUSC family protein [Gorillibacterium massiliense]|uniref:FUSC family protein n=1 Tax=Gorillibacterium massiliense TaxID=1280390 RepID=UPI0004B94CB8|nr:FUSC family protein [Gorillibacterium massiliense]
MKTKQIAFLYTNAIVWKLPAAAAISWAIAKWAGSSHPYLAPLAVVLTFQVTISKTLQYAWMRVIGTIAGVLFAAFITPYIGLNAWSLALMLLIGTVISARFHLDHTLMIQISLSILLVMYFQSKMPDYPIDRIRDTFIGAAIAVLVQMLILPPDSLSTAERKLNQLADHFSCHFISAAQWVDHGCSKNEAVTLKNELQGLFKELHQATMELDKSNKSLKYNALAKDKNNLLQEMTRRLNQLRLGYANLSDMVRVLERWSGSGSMTKADRSQWADYLSRFAAFMKEWKQTSDVSNPSAQTRSAILQIKAPPSLEQEKYRLALYTSAEQIIHDFLWEG